jgi:hypothetical protein
MVLQPVPVWRVQLAKDAFCLRVLTTRFVALQYSKRPLLSERHTPVPQLRQLNHRSSRPAHMCN